MYNLIYIQEEDGRDLYLILDEKDRYSLLVPEDIDKLEKVTQGMLNKTSKVTPDAFIACDKVVELIATELDVGGLKAAIHMHQLLGV